MPNPSCCFSATMYHFPGFGIIFILELVLSVRAFECLSYGVDYVDGGGPYCVNTASSDPFSFSSFFKGMLRPCRLEKAVRLLKMLQAVTQTKAVSHPSSLTRTETSIFAQIYRAFQTVSTRSPRGIRTSSPIDGRV